MLLHYRLDEAVGYGKRFFKCKICQSIIGAWGKVKKGWDCERNQPVAIKILSKRRISRKIRDGVSRIKK